MHESYDFSELRTLFPFVRVGDEAPLLWRLNVEDPHVLYLADEAGLWMRVPAEHSEALDFEAVTGFRLEELTLKVLHGVSVYALKGGMPLLSFPFTALELRAFDDRVGGVFSERISCGGETSELISDLAQHSPRAASLAHVMIYGVLAASADAGVSIALATGIQRPATGRSPLITREVAYCFADLRWPEIGWKRVLGNNRKWLLECLVVPGIRGKAPRRWNPVLIGAALVIREAVPANRVRARFQKQLLLEPWLDTWKTYEAEHIGTD